SPCVPGRRRPGGSGSDRDGLARRDERGTSVACVDRPVVAGVCEGARFVADRGGELSVEVPCDERTDAAARFEVRREPLEELADTHRRVRGAGGASGERARETVER